jgi:thymidylate synthase (FAD)
LALLENGGKGGKMKILKSAGRFEILTPKEELQEQLLRIERAGRTCYQSEKKEVSLESAERFVRMILKRGHESVLEHSSLIVKFYDVSRGLTHELVRHRLCGFSQESTRYVDYAKEGEGPDLDRFQLRCVVPPHRDEREKIKLEDGREMSASDMLAEIEKFYRGLRKGGWLPEDARQLLPQAIKADIVVSTNFREWRHIFELRTQQPALWEIREVLGNLLVELKGILPVIFEDFEEAGVDSNGLRYFQKKKVGD